MGGLQTFDNAYALIIGVGADLPMTVVDATAIRDILADPERAAYNPDNVSLLTEENATRESILNSFDELINKVDDDDTVIIYYSGHGGFEQEENEYYLVPYKFNPENRPNTGISANEFTQKINAISSQKLVVFLDCCHAGGMAIKKDIRDTKLLNYIKSDNFQEKAPADLINNLQQGSGRFFIASSKENEYSIAAKPYSIFTECLIKALAGAGTVENQEGYARIFDVTGYLLTSVPRRSEDFPPYTQSQNPVVKYIHDATANFPLCYYSGGQTVKKPLPNEPSPVFTDSQTHNLTIYGVVYELQLNKRQPLRDVKVKIPGLMHNSTRTNIDGNFILTNVPESINADEIEIVWNDNSYLLPISEEGKYEIEKTPDIISPPPTNWFKEIFDFIKKLFADDFWKKAIVLLVGLIAFSTVGIIVLINPDLVSCENRFIQIFIAALIGLYSALVLFFFVPPDTNYKSSITIVTSTGFMLGLIILFSKIITCDEIPLPTVKDIEGTVFQINPVTKLSSPVQGAKVTLGISGQTIPTDNEGKFKFKDASSDENKISVYINSKAEGTCDLKPVDTECKIVNPFLDDRKINETFYYLQPDVWTEIKAPEKLGDCPDICKAKYPSYSDVNYIYQIFRFKKDNIKHMNDYPVFFVEVGIDPTSSQAELCHTKINKNNVSFNDDPDKDENVRKKYMKWNVVIERPVLEVQASLCITSPKDKPVTLKDLVARTWSQKISN